MELSQYVDRLQRELLTAADAGGDDARELAGRLTAPLDSATRLVLLEALSAAADEITSDLAPGSVEVRLRGREPSFVVTPPATDESFDAAAAADRGSAPLPPAPAADPDSEEQGISRINLRLPESLKKRAEEAANREGLSLNAWLVRAVAAAVDPDVRHSAPSQPGPRGRQTYSGWVR